MVGLFWFCLCASPICAPHACAWLPLVSGGLLFRGPRPSRLSGRVSVLSPPACSLSTALLVWAVFWPLPLTCRNRLGSKQKPFYLPHAPPGLQCFPCLRGRGPPPLAPWSPPWLGSAPPYVSSRARLWAVLLAARSPADFCAVWHLALSPSCPLAAPGLLLPSLPLLFLSRSGLGVSSSPPLLLCPRWALFRSSPGYLPRFCTRFAAPYFPRSPPPGRSRPARPSPDPPLRGVAPRAGVVPRLFVPSPWRPLPVSLPRVRLPFPPSSFPLPPALLGAPWLGRPFVAPPFVSPPPPPVRPVAQFPAGHSPRPRAGGGGGSAGLCPPSVCPSAPARLICSVPGLPSARASGALCPFCSRLAPRSTPLLAGCGRASCLAAAFSPPGVCRRGSGGVSGAPLSRSPRKLPATSGYTNSLLAVVWLIFLPHMEFSNAMMLAKWAPQL